MDAENDNTQQAAETDIRGLEGMLKIFLEEMLRGGPHYRTRGLNYSKWGEWEIWSGALKHVTPKSWKPVGSDSPQVVGQVNRTR